MSIPPPYSGLSYPHAIYAETSSAAAVQNVTSSSATSVGDPHTATSIESSLQSVPKVGVSVTKTFHLSAAHHLPHHQGKCRNHHGHNYKISITATGVVHPLDPYDPESGMVKDFYNMTKDAAKVILCHDHQNLNDAFPNPTAENLALTWLTQLRGLDPWYTSVTVWETDDCSATAEIIS